MINRLIRLITQNVLVYTIIDDQLSWRKHIDQISTKISKMTGIMAKARHVLSNIQTLKTIYNTIIGVSISNILWHKLYGQALTKLG